MSEDVSPEVADMIETKYEVSMNGSKKIKFENGSYFMEIEDGNTEIKIDVVAIMREDTEDEQVKRTRFRLLLAEKGEELIVSKQHTKKEVWEDVKDRDEYDIDHQNEYMFWFKHTPAINVDPSHKAKERFYRRLKKLWEA